MFSPISITLSGKSMSHLTLANATDIAQWADRRESQGLLPKLIRRLILRSTNDATSIYFPAEEGVSKPGWDGVVSAEEGNGPDFSDGFYSGVLNSRGVTSRSPFDGGMQERELERKYMDFARRVAGRWPKTAALLRKIAGHYRADAIHEDQRATLNEDLDR